MSDSVAVSGSSVRRWTHVRHSVSEPCSDRCQVRQSVAGLPPLVGEQGRQVKLLQGGMHPRVCPSCGVAFGVAQPGMLDDIDKGQPNQPQCGVALAAVQIVAVA